MLTHPLPYQQCLLTDGSTVLPMTHSKRTVHSHQHQVSQIRERHHHTLTVGRHFTSSQRSCKPHEWCESCWKKKRWNTPTAEASSIIEATTDTIGQVSGISQPQPPGSRKQSLLPHHIFNKGEWRRARITDHPQVPLKRALDSHPNGFVNINGITDTGSQSDLWSLDEFLSAGFSMDDLSPVSLSLNAANKSPITIHGAFFARFEGCSHNGDRVSCRSMVYVSRDVKSLYLSYDTMLELGIIDSDFPVVGKFSPTLKPAKTNNVYPSGSTSAGSICGATRDDGAICDCPKRAGVPDRPASLQFQCTPENNGMMKEWLLSRYCSSKFNTCPHQGLPEMTGPPVDIHLRQEARPVACHKATSIPIYWKDKVHADLKRDEALGVIEPVPFGEPVEWCHRMVVTRKQDGTPRRTVDLSPLNKYCKRETHNSESPFHLVRRIPRNTWKTVTDAWNGFHSVLLRRSTPHNFYYAIRSMALRKNSTRFPLIWRWLSFLSKSARIASVRRYPCRLRKEGAYRWWHYPLRRGPWGTLVAYNRLPFHPWCGWYRTKPRELSVCSTWGRFCRFSNLRRQDRPTT